MTDFLTRLAARQLGGIPAVAPRVASLFEPVAAAADETEVLPLEEHHLAGTDPSPSSLRAPAVGGRHLPLGPADADGEPADDHRQLPDHQGRHSSSVSLNSPSHVSSPPKVLKGAGVQETVQTREPARLLPRLRRSSRQKPLVITPVRMADESANLVAPAVPEPTAVRTGPLKKEQPRALPVSGEVRTIQSLVGPATPAAIPAVERIIMPARSSEARWSRDDAGGTKASAEPVVHVTIGRIEVTAVTAAPAKRAMPPRDAPSLLDDYLARSRTRKP
jgi:hypothetical protein